jgi:hypothetical protein
VEDLEPDVDIDLIGALTRETARQIKQGDKPKKTGFFGLFRRDSEGA